MITMPVDTKNNWQYKTQRWHTVITGTGNSSQGLFGIKTLGAVTQSGEIKTAVIPVANSNDCPTMQF
jgi:hypothetical protein